MGKSRDEILAMVPAIRETTKSLRELILADLVLIGEIPSATFNEERRVALLQDRFIEAGLQNPSTDQAGNALGMLPGTAAAKRNILLTAHVDTVLDADEDHTVSVQPDTITGAVLADNALGLAVLVSLPVILEAMHFRPDNNVVFLGAARSMGRGNLEGLRSFLENSVYPITHGVCLESLQLGRLNYLTMGMLRAEVRVSLPKEYDWTHTEVIGGVQTISEIVSRIIEIPLPRKPQTHVILGSVQAGNTYNVISTSAVLKFEIRSESSEMVEEIFRKIEAITVEIASMNRAEIKLEVIARRSPGGLTFDHPFPRMASEIIKALGVEPNISPSTTMLSAFAAAKIPAVTLGLTRGFQFGDKTDVLEIEPIFTGITQVICLLMAIDSGLCDDQLA